LISQDKSHRALAAPADVPPSEITAMLSHSLRNEDQLAGGKVIYDAHVLKAN
jgi:hypothetical protein